MASLKNESDGWWGPRLVFSNHRANPPSASAELPNFTLPELSASWLVNCLIADFLASSSSISLFLKPQAFPSQVSFYLMHDIPSLAQWFVHMSLWSCARVGRVVLQIVIVQSSHPNTLFEKIVNLSQNDLLIIIKLQVRYTIKIQT